MMFGESFHPEVIKKSHFLLEFLYNNNRIGEEQINLMWDCANQKHEAYKIAILKALMFLASKVKSKELRLLYMKIKMAPLNHVDKFLMHLLKTIAKNISSTIGWDPMKEKLSQRRQDLLTCANKPQRRSSDVGISGGLIDNQGYDNKVTTYDDHDIKKKVQIVNDYIKPPFFKPRSSS